jgi:hypothetical protein
MGSRQPQRDSDWFKPGRYVMRVDKFSFGTTRAGRDYALFNFTVLAVLDDMEAAKGPGGPHRVGDRCSWMLMSDRDASAPALKAAVMTLTGSTESEEIDDALFEQLASPANPLGGLFAEVDCRVIITKQKGVPFNLVKVKRPIEFAELQTIVQAETLSSMKITG